MEKEANWLGQALRGKNLLTVSLQGTEEGISKQGRKRLKLVDTK